MIRLLVLAALVFCFLGFATIAHKRWVKHTRKPAPTPMEQIRDVWEADGRLLSYPTAAVTSDPGKVKSPHLADTYLRVSGLRPGQLVRCGVTGKPFYVPFRKDFEYGDLVGHWRINRFGQAKTIEYDVRIKANLHGFTGEGRRVRVNGSELPNDKQSRLALKAMHFENDRLHCRFEEHLSGTNTTTGEFRWQFSSAQDLLQGHAFIDGTEQMIVSEGERYAGSRGRVPASADTPAGLIPKGWTMLDSVEGKLTSTGGRFIVVVAEEPGADPLRWLILAQNDRKRGQCTTILATTHACRAGIDANQADPFHGISLPNQENVARPGEFVLRHHLSLDERHQGEDFWFRYHPLVKEWRLVDGRQYAFALNASNKVLQTWALVPGATLAEFDIKRLRYQLPDSKSSSGQSQDNPWQTPRPMAYRQP